MMTWNRYCILKFFLPFMHVCQEMMGVTMQYPSCGLIQNPDLGPEVVITNWGHSEIFNLAARSWRPGPEAPYLQESTVAAALWVL